MGRVSFFSRAFNERARACHVATLFYMNAVNVSHNHSSIASSVFQGQRFMNGVEFSGVRTGHPKSRARHAYIGLLRIRGS